MKYTSNQSPHQSSVSHIHPQTNQKINNQLYQPLEHSRIHRLVNNHFKLEIAFEQIQPTEIITIVV